MKYLLRVLFNPVCWLQNNSYSAEWDFELKQLLCEHKFVKTSSCTAMLGDVHIWIENHPYSSFHPYSNSLLHKQPDGFDFDDEIRPSRMTIFYAMDRLQDDLR